MWGVGIVTAASLAAASLAPLTQSKKKKKSEEKGKEEESPPLNIDEVKTKLSRLVMNARIGKFRPSTVFVKELQNPTRTLVDFRLNNEVGIVRLIVAVMKEFPECGSIVPTIDADGTRKLVFDGGDLAITLAAAGGTGDPPTHTVFP